jgi:hypothetical protein
VPATGTQQHDLLDEWGCAQIGRIERDKRKTLPLGEN